MTLGVLTSRGRMIELCLFVTQATPAIPLNFAVNRNGKVFKSSASGMPRITANPLEKCHPFIEGCGEGPKVNWRNPHYTHSPKIVRSLGMFFGDQGVEGSSLDAYSIVSAEALHGAEVPALPRLRRRGRNSSLSLRRRGQERGSFDCAQDDRAFD
jgi:hypothetical protein